MGQLIPNSFSSYDLTEQETVAGSVLTELQRQVIQNQIHLLAMQKLNSEFDPSDPHKFTKEIANLDGQIFSLQWLLRTSEDIEKQLAQFRANQTQV